VKISRKSRALLGAAAIGVMSGCASLKRAGTDLAVVVTSPVTIVVGGVHDALDWGKSTNDAFPMVLAPVTVPGHMLKHVAYTLCYAGDLLLSPFYLLGSIGKDKGLEPIDLYVLNEGYPWKTFPVPVWEK
jgi:hypothetical protein